MGFWLGSLWIYISIWEELQSYKQVQFIYTCKISIQNAGLESQPLFQTLLSIYLKHIIKLKR